MVEPALPVNFWPERTGDVRSPLSNNSKKYSYFEKAFCDLLKKFRYKSKFSRSLLPVPWVVGCRCKPISREQVASVERGLGEGKERASEENEAEAVEEPDQPSVTVVGDVLELGESHDVAEGVREGGWGEVVGADEYEGAEHAEDGRVEGLEEGGEEDLGSAVVAARVLLVRVVYVRRPEEKRTKQYRPVAKRWI